MPRPSISVTPLKSLTGMARRRRATRVRRLGPHNRRRKDPSPQQPNPKTRRGPSSGPPALDSIGPHVCDDMAPCRMEPWDPQGGPLTLYGITPISLVLRAAALRGSNADRASGFAVQLLAAICSLSRGLTTRPWPLAGPCSDVSPLFVTSGVQDRGWGGVYLHEASDLMHRQARTFRAMSPLFVHSGAVESFAGSRGMGTNSNYRARCDVPDLFLPDSRWKLWTGALRGCIGMACARRVSSPLWIFSVAAIRVVPRVSRSLDPKPHLLAVTTILAVTTRMTTWSR